MVLLIFHLVLSGFTFDCVDLSMAEKVLEWYLKRYPDGLLPSAYRHLRLTDAMKILGVFFQFGAGRLALVRSQPKTAIKYYRRAMEVQTQYK